MAYKTNKVNKLRNIDWQKRDKRNKSLIKGIEKIVYNQR
jgi:hypothetical protein